MEIRTCGKCDRYSYQVRRCSLGQVNPKTLKGTISAAKFGGMSYICPYSKWLTKARKELKNPSK